MTESFDTFHDAGVIRISKPALVSSVVIESIISSYWSRLSSPAASDSLTGKVDDVGYSIAALQDYVEGAVYQLSAPLDEVRAAVFLLYMHPMDQPRPPGCPNRGKIIDSGMHYHLGPRALTAYIAPNSLISIPCLSRPMFVGMQESKDYVLRTKRFLDSRFPGRTRTGWEVVLFAGQILEIEFDAGIAHSFNAIGGRCLIVSRHADEWRELVAARQRTGFQAIGDGSIFLIEPQSLTSGDLDYYRSLIAPCAGRPSSGAS